MQLHITYLFYFAEMRSQVDVGLIIHVYKDGSDHFPSNTRVILQTPLGIKHHQPRMAT